MTSRDLHELMLKKQRTEEEFYDKAGEYIVSLLHEKGKDGENGYKFLEADDVFGDDCRVMYTNEIENDEVTGSEGSEYEWEFDEITELNGIVNIQCEGYDFNLEDFEEESVVVLAKKLEEYDGKKEG